MKRFLLCSNMIDAHSHVQLLLNKGIPLALIKERAKSVGVTRAVSCSCSFSDWGDSQFWEDPFVLPQFGIHPWWVMEERPADWVDRLVKKLIEYPSAGVGEIGLHKKKKDVPFPVQLEVFKAQLQVAKQLQRTVSVHCVNAYGTLIEVLKSESFTGPVVIHSFSGNGDQIQALIRNWNVFFSVSANCPRNEVILLIPLDRLLVETDSPDQTSSPNFSIPFPTVPPKLDESTNDCSQLPLVVERVARARGMSFAEIAQISESNTIRAFQISHPICTL